MSRPSWLRKPSHRAQDIGLTLLVIVLVLPGSVASADAGDKWQVAALTFVTALLRRLLDHGVEVERIAPVRSTLEERFLTMTTRLEDRS